MLNFFRNIRRKYANENSFVKYSRYAIGEILLVVVGILIALQVNTWNEERKAHNEELVLLKILKTDFENRLNELVYLNKGRHDAAFACEKLIKISETEIITLTSDEIDSLLVNVTLTYRFNEKFSTLDMLFNSGRINTLSNEPLKYLLVNWPSLVEEMLEEQRLIVDNYSDIVKAMNPYVSMNDVFQKFSWNNIQMPDIKKSKIKKDYEGLFRDRSFKNLIASKRFLLYVNIADANNIITDAKKIIELINQIIEN